MPYTAGCPDEENPDDSGASVQRSDNIKSLEMDALNPSDNGTIPDNIKSEEPDDVQDFPEVSSSSLLSYISRACGSKLKEVLLFSLGLLYVTYFIVAIILDSLGSCDEDCDILPLVYITVFGIFIIAVHFVKAKFAVPLRRCVTLLNERVNEHWDILKWIIVGLPLAGVVGVIIYSAVQRPSNLISLLGWSSLFLFLLICSKAPKKINWRTVLGGFALQFLFAVLILKWDFGYKVFNFLGELFKNFLNFSEFGAKFVFGKLDDHVFAFKVLPVIIFFSCVITTLYYLGVMQAVIEKIAFIMRITLHTTAAESLCAAGNIFVGQTEAPIMIRPFLALMTRSELHAVMVGGFATIAGAVLAAYVLKGVSPTHLLTASVMNAPTALAVSKMLYPELGTSKIAEMKKIIKEVQPYRNAIEAGAAGASAAISLVANIAANLIAFIALLYFFNYVISWFGSFICYPDLSFQVICHYALMPLTFLMGVEWADAGKVAELIGIKTFLNEFYAYDILSSEIKSRISCIDVNAMSVRSEIISTYALCGFANLGSVGIQLGGLGSMAPNRKGDLAQIAVTALLGGIVTNLMTACIAGLLVVEMPFDVASCVNTTVSTADLSAAGNGTLLS